MPTAFTYDFSLVCFILGYFALIYVMFYFRNKLFSSSNLKPSIHSVDTLKIKNDIYKVPVVKTGIIIQGFPKFDVNHNQFLLNCLVWFRFNRSLISIESIEKFSFLNAISMQKNLLNVSVENDDFILEYQVQLEFYSQLDHKFFPINDHSIYMVLENNQLTSEEVIFDCDNGSVSIGNNLELNDWNVVGTEAQSGYDYIASSLGNYSNPIPYPRVLYTLNIKKVGLRKFAFVILPVILILFISSSALMLGNFSDNIALLISIGSLTGVLAYRYVLNSMSPNVGYFTLAEYIYNYCLIAIFIGFLLVLDAVIQHIDTYSMFGPLWFGVVVSVLFVYIVYLLFFMRSNKKIALNQFDLNQYVDNLPDVDLSKWNIKYLSQLKVQKKIAWFSNIKKMLFNPILSWPDTLKLMKVYQQQYLKDCHYIEFKVSLTSRIIIIANIFNSIHHFLDYIDELIYQNILDEQLFLQSKDDCVIFHQNICQSIAELAEVYPLQLILMMKNPNQVFLLQDEYFVYDVWSNNLNFSFTNGIFKKSPESFRQFTMNFFNHLPKQLLMDVNVNQSFSYGIQIISEINKELIRKNPEWSPHIEEEYIQAQIHNLNSHVFKNNEIGLLSKIPENSAVRWYLNSGSQKKVEFAMLRFSNNKSDCYLDWYSKSKNTSFKFDVKRYSLLYAYQIKKNHAACTFDSNILIGSSSDLSTSLNSYSNNIARGGYLKFIEQNSLGGIQHQSLKAVIMDDGYNPSMTLKNAEKLMRLSSKPALMLSVMATATLERLLPHILAKDLFVFFPITGANSLRQEKYENLLFFRASYKNEAITILHDMLDIKKCKRIAIFYQNDSFGLSLLEPSRDYFKNYDVQWLEVPYQRNNTQTAYAAKCIKDFNPDGLILYSISVPAISLIHDLSVAQAADLQMYMSSAANFMFTNFASTVGLNVNYCLAAPPLTERMEIVQDYLRSFKNTPYAFDPNPGGLEGYVNASILCDILSHIDGPITSQSLLNRAEQMTNYSFKGLSLNYNPLTRELFNYTWLARL